MEGSVFQMNLAILNPMAKLVCHSGMRIVRYNRAARLEIQRSKIQAYPNNRIIF